MEIGLGDEERPVRMLVWNKKLGFLTLVIYFTLFGGGRSDDWTIVCHDQAGYTYEVDNNSIKGGPERVSLLVRTFKGERYQDHRWVIDLNGNTLQVGSQAPQWIEDGSVASDVVSHLRKRKRAAEPVVRVDKGAESDGGR